MSFEISEETQLRMMKHSAEVVQLFANMGSMPRPPRSTISDEQYAKEITLARELRASFAQLYALIERVNDESGFMKIDAQSFKDWVHDETPDPGQLDEKLTMARRGYETASGSLK